MTPNECQAARFLNAAGHSQESIADFLDAQRLTAGRHIADDCSCPDLEEPRIVPPVDGDELRAAREAAGLTQVELGEIVGTSNGTISGLERESVDASQPLRYRIHEWLDSQESE